MSMVTLFFFLLQVLMLTFSQNMQPITFALVYVGTTLKDIADVTHGWSEVSTSRWVRISIKEPIS